MAAGTTRRSHPPPPPPPFLQMEEAIDGGDALAGELTERRTDSAGERGPPNLNGMI